MYVINRDSSPTGMSRSQSAIDETLYNSLADQHGSSGIRDVISSPEQNQKHIFEMSDESGAPRDTTLTVPVILEVSTRG